MFKVIWDRDYNGVRLTMSSKGEALSVAPRPVFWEAARDCIKSREVEVLNYFINRATNASAESLHSKMKGFRAQLHGIADIPFFMYRICTIFG